MRGLRAEGTKQRRGRQELERQEGAPGALRWSSDLQHRGLGLLATGPERINPGCLSRSLCGASYLPRALGRPRAPVRGL